ncbi:MAG: cyanophycinase, partial [Acidimicrobiales bacterium]
MPLGAHGPARSGEGDLLVIGGAEDKLGKRTVLNEFVRRAGGSDARIAVIPTASSLGPEIIDVYAALFGRLGAAEVYGVRPEDRDQAQSAEMVKELDRATGIFMTGGNQLKLSTVIAGTAFADAILEARGRGVTIAGTSAGASIQSSHMVAFGPGGSTPKQRMTQVAAGLGLVEICVIDQHFAQRNRYGRLLMIVSQSPQLLGMGVDEDTAAIITRTEEAEMLRVVGRGSVTLFDGSHMVSNAHEAKERRPILASGVVLHVLPQGAEFDLTSRKLVPPRTVIDPSEADELAMANRDLRKMARDIAAGDVSPSVLRRRIAR